MSLRFFTAGESHGPSLVAILEGVPAGLALDKKMIDHQLERRQTGYGKGARMHLEKDEVVILSGLMEGMTIGSPITLQIINLDHEKWKGKEVPAFTTPRPGHADLSGLVKYDFNDLRPVLERASARETAARVAVGAVCLTFLENLGIKIGGYVVSLGEITASLDGMVYEDRFRLAEESDVRCPDLIAAEQMHTLIRQIMDERDTLGGVIEVVALGLPPGLGSYAQWDRRLDARLAGGVMSIPAFKGVEIGPAFENTRHPGTKVHDPIHLEGDKLIRTTNHSGGIEGGISNGEPLIVRAAMKPIPTTLTPQSTVDLATGQETPTRYERSDFCPTPRAVPVVEAMVAFILADALLEKVGGDSMKEILPRVNKLRKTRLTDLRMDQKPHIFWQD